MTNNQSGLKAEFNKNYSIKLGAILGLISLILGVVILFVAKNLTTFWAITIFSYSVNTILYMIIAVVFSFMLRKKNGGFWTFSVALKSIFLMLLISTLISTIGTQIYVSYINPTLQQEVLYNTINVTIEYMEQSGAPEDVIDSNIAKLEEQIDAVGKITFFQALRGVVIPILMQFVFSLVLAALTKKERLYI